MIAPQELRIGNWVNTRKGNDKVVDVLCDSINTMRGGDILDNIDPIPLSPEILEKCGFEKDGFGAYNMPLVCKLIATEKMYQLSFSGDYLYVRQSNGCGVDDLVTVWNKDVMRVFYLHQLQNLYFALTSTELTITI